MSSRFRPDAAGVALFALVLACAAVAANAAAPTPAPRGKAGANRPLREAPTSTIDDSTVFSRPWTIRMPLYRIVDEGFRILEFKCEPYAEEKIYGHLRKPGTEPPAGSSSR